MSDSLYATTHLRYGTGTNGRFIKLFEDFVEGSLEDMLYDAFRVGKWMCPSTGMQGTQPLAQ